MQLSNFNTSITAMAITAIAAVFEAGQNDLMPSVIFMAFFLLFFYCAVKFHHKEVSKRSSHYPQYTGLDRATLEMKLANAESELKTIQENKYDIWNANHMALFEKLNIENGDIVICKHPSPYLFLMETNEILEVLKKHFGYKWGGMLQIPPEMTLETMDAGHALQCAKEVLGVDIVYTVKK